MRDLDAFDGGIRNAGSNLNLARFAIDGDPATGWAPDPEAEAENWFLEVNLGRAVSAHSITLVFDEAAAPFELFDLLISTGEPETDVIAAPIEGSLVYRTKARFKENTRHRVTYEIAEIDAEPLQFIRFEPLLTGARRPPSRGRSRDHRRQYRSRSAGTGRRRRHQYQPRPD